MNGTSRKRRAKVDQGVMRVKVSAHARLRVYPVIEQLAEDAARDAWLNYWHFREGEPDEATREAAVETMADAFRGKILEVFDFDDDNA
jgi:hypothetical protein